MMPVCHLHNTVSSLKQTQELLLDAQGLTKSDRMQKIASNLAKVNILWSYLMNPLERVCSVQIC